MVRTGLAFGRNAVRTITFVLHTMPGFVQSVAVLASHTEGVPVLGTGSAERGVAVFAGTFFQVALLSLFRVRGETIGAVLIAVLGTNRPAFWKTTVTPTDVALAQPTSNKMVALLTGVAGRLLGLQTLRPDDREAPGASTDTKMTLPIKTIVALGTFVLLAHFPRDIPYGTIPLRVVVGRAHAAETNRPAPTVGEFLPGSSETLAKSTTNINLLRYSYLSCTLDVRRDRIVRPFSQTQNFFLP